MATYQCEWNECHESFKDVTELVSHIKSHTDESKKDAYGKVSYSCLWRNCLRRGEAQNSKFALSQHLRMHTGERPFVCPVATCSARFSRIDNMRKHAKKHSIGNEELAKLIQDNKRRKKPGNSEEKKKTIEIKKVSESESDSDIDPNFDVDTDELEDLSADDVSEITDYGKLQKRNMKKAITKKQTRKLGRIVKTMTRAIEERRAPISRKEKLLNFESLETLDEQKQYQILLNIFQYNLNENELLESELESIKKKIKLIRKEKNILLEELMKKWQQNI